MDMLVEIFTTSLTPIVFLYMFVGVVAGICIGALPGLTATMGVALLLPMTFGMEAAQGILMLLGIYVGAIYGGSISAVLLHTPARPLPLLQLLRVISCLSVVKQVVHWVLPLWAPILAVLFLFCVWF